MKRREAKDKGEKERYTHLNAEFQRIARRDEKTFFSDQCKEITGKQQNGKDQRSLQEKLRYISNTFLMFKETFHTKMNTIKDRTGTELKEAEDIKKRWQEYTEELYKKRS